MSVYQEKPWLKFYEPHVPEHIDYPQTIIPDALAETARKYPDHPNTIFMDNKITYREYNETVDRFAAALQELGVQKGDRVANPPAQLPPVWRHLQCRSADWWHRRAMQPHLHGPRDEASAQCH